MQTNHYSFSSGVRPDVSFIMPCYNEEEIIGYTIPKMVSAFDERRRVIVPLLNQLQGFKCLDPGGAFYVFPDITGTGMDARELQNKMLEQAGVATVAGTSFGIHGEGYIRFSYANSVENIREAIRRIAALLRD